MRDFPLMLHVKLPVVDRIQPKSNKFAMGVENEATCDSKLNNSPAVLILYCHQVASNTRFLRVINGQIKGVSLILL